MSHSEHYGKLRSFELSIRRQRWVLAASGLLWLGAWVWLVSVLVWQVTPGRLFEPLVHARDCRVTGPMIIDGDHVWHTCGRGRLARRDLASARFAFWDGVHSPLAVAPHPSGDLAWVETESGGIRVLRIRARGGVDEISRIPDEHRVLGLAWVDDPPTLELVSAVSSLRPSARVNVRRFDEESHVERSVSLTRPAEFAYRAGGRWRFVSLEVRPAEISIHETGEDGGDETVQRLAREFDSEVSLDMARGNVLDGLRGPDRVKSQYLWHGASGWKVLERPPGARIEIDFEVGGHLRSVPRFITSRDGVVTTHLVSVSTSGFVGLSRQYDGPREPPITITSPDGAAWEVARDMWIDERRPVRRADGGYWMFGMSVARLDERFRRADPLSLVERVSRVPTVFGIRRDFKYSKLRLAGIGAVLLAPMFAIPWALRRRRFEWLVAAAWVHLAIAAASLGSFFTLFAEL